MCGPDDMWSYNCFQLEFCFFFKIRSRWWRSRFTLCQAWGGGFVGNKAHAACIILWAVNRSSEMCFHFWRAGWTLFLSRVTFSHPVTSPFWRLWVSLVEPCPKFMFMLCKLSGWARPVSSDQTCVEYSGLLGSWWFDAIKRNSFLLKH